MKKYINETFDEERALYGSKDVVVEKCSFDGPADGESALKESSDIEVKGSYFNLRYPFWHNKHLHIADSEMTNLCRAAIWYSEDISIDNTKLHGIKGLRECSDVMIRNSDIVSPEFGWSVHNITMKDTTADSEYFMMRSDNLRFENVSMKGKYSFQYIEDSEFINCNFDTKDAFWHAKNVVVKDSVVKGEYLAWYCENVTFDNCVIIGTQPLCYCKNLELINCKMQETDLSFEKSDVYAIIDGSIISIKNPYSGSIVADHVDEIIIDDNEARCEIKLKDNIGKS